MPAPFAVSVDTSRPLELRHAPLKMFAYVALGLVMTAASLVLALPVVPELADDAFMRAIGGVGALFFGFCTGMWLWRTLTLDVVVTLSPEGLRDVRLAREVLPWSAIDRLSIHTTQGQNFVVVTLAPEVERRLTLTRVARWTRRPNRLLGADGLIVYAHGLAVDFATLWALVQAYAAAHGAPAARADASGPSSR